MRVCVCTSLFYLGPIGPCSVAETRTCTQTFSAAPSSAEYVVTAMKAATGKHTIQAVEVFKNTLTSAHELVTEKIIFYISHYVNYSVNWHLKIG